jgi:hypothetical protein
MLMPWRVTTARDRSQLSAALAHFTGQFLLPTHAGVAELQRRVATDTDNQRDIWIATGRTEHPLSLFSLLHARVTPGTEAAIDVMAAADAPGSRSAKGYVGFGEFVLLASLLEKTGVHRLALPLQVDLDASGLADAGWQAAWPGMYLRSSHRRTAAEPRTRSQP